MKFKKTLLAFCLIMCIFFCVSSVAAGDVNDTIVGSDDNQIELSQDSINDVDNLKSNENDEILTATPKTFSSLNTTINGNDDKDVYLDSNYTFELGSDADFKDGVTISRAVTIHGNGFTLDGNNAARIFSVTNNNVVFNDIVFANGRVEGHGGAINGNCTVINCTFISNTASGHGGAIYFSSSCTVENCNFINNSAGVIIISNPYVIIPPTIDKFYGGAIYFNSNNGTVSNCNFVNNTASGGRGGAIMMDSGTVSNCNFINNHANYGGAIMMVSGTVSNCNFINNKAPFRSGGAILMASGTVSNCNFVNNTASSSGGAVYFNRKGNVANCNFTNNQVTDGYGGAIGISDAHPALTVVNCNFVNNTASGSGGAIMMDSGTVSNCNFINNHANYGGAIYYNGYVKIISNSYFVNNSAEYNGGAICSGSIESFVFTGDFIGNTASYGGAIYGNIKNSIFNGDFSENTANTGGAICGNITESTINGDFTDNVADVGGGICGNITDSIFNGDFTKNNASAGGAICGNIIDSIFNGNFIKNAAITTPLTMNNILSCTDSSLLNFAPAMNGVGGGICGNVMGTTLNTNFVMNTADVGAIIAGNVEKSTFTGKISQNHANDGIIISGDVIKSVFSGDIADISEIYGEISGDWIDSFIKKFLDEKDKEQLERLQNLTKEFEFEIESDLNIYVDDATTINPNEISVLYHFDIMNFTLDKIDNYDVSKLKDISNPLDGPLGIIFDKMLDDFLHNILKDSPETDLNGSTAYLTLEIRTLNNLKDAIEIANAFGCQFKDKYFKVVKEFTLNDLSVKIAPGVYRGDKNKGLEIITNYTLMKDGEGEVIIDAENNGNILTVKCREINIDGLTFMHASDSAIILEQGLSDSVINANFIENTAGSSSKVYLGNDLFTGGGAIFIKDTVKNSVIKGNFIDNSAIDTNFTAGGAIFIPARVSDSIFSGNFIGNKAIVYGGAIFIDYVVLDSIFNGNFSDNSARAHAVFAANIVNSTFNTNFVENNGGGVGAYYDISGSIFSGNFTKNSGRAIKALLDISGSIFNGNFVENIDGAIEGNDVSDCIFSGNFVNNTAEYKGGAINCRNSFKNSILSGNFVNNKAKYGGAISMSEPYGSIFNVTFCGNFTNNSATSEGGAVYSGNGVYYCTFNGNFIKNTAKYGGVIYAYGALIYKSTFEGHFKENTAEKGNVVYADCFYDIPGEDKYYYNIANIPESDIYDVQYDTYMNYPDEEFTLGVTLQDVLSCNFDDSEKLLSTSSNEIYVDGISSFDGDGSPFNPFNNLKSAITQAEDGDTIYIYSGTYVGENNTGLTINKSLNLVKIGNGEAIFDAQENGRILTVNTTSIVIIIGLTFTHATDSAITFNTDIVSSRIEANFENNKNKAALYIIGNSINSIFTGNYINNTANDGGAAIHAESFICCELNANFINNTATNGGAITGDIISSTINGIFANNNANYGGAIFGNVMSSAFGAEFVNNSASGDGGAIFGNVSSSNFTNNFINNNAQYSGGVIYGSVSGSNFNNDFINNQAKHSYGGVISGSVSGSSFCGDFINNQAGLGGVNSGSASSSNFAGKFINNDAYGGVIAGWDFSKLLFKGEFIDNGAKVGKGKIVYSTNYIIDSKFIGDIFVSNLTNIVELIDCSNVINCIFNNREPIDEKDMNVPALSNSTGKSVTVRLPGDATGTITLNISGESYNFDVVGGVANVQVPDLANGVYPYNIIYSGDENYASFTKKGSLTIFNSTQNTTDSQNITNNPKPISDNQINISSFDSGLGEVQLPNDASGKLTITIDGVNYTFDVINGNVSIDLSNLTNGNYDYTLEYSGDDKYAPFTRYGSLNINRPIDTVVSQDLIVDYDENYDFTATFLNSDGSLLSNVYIVFKVNNDEYSIKTDSNGVAILKLGLNPGEYNITSINTRTDESKINRLTIVGGPETIKNTIITASDINMTYGDETYLVATLTDDDNEKIMGVELVIDINGQAIKDNTDGNGQVKLLINITPNVYHVVISFKGNAEYGYSTKNITVVVNRMESEIVVPPLDKPSEDGSVEVKLPLDATGTVILTVNNQNYTFNVKDGIANVKLPELSGGDYNYTIKYSGDSKYSSFTNNGSLKVNKTNANPVENQTNTTGNNTAQENTPAVDNSKIVASNVNVVYFAGSYYTIKVYGTDGKLANCAVKISGKISKSLTAKKGIAKFMVTQAPGTYKIKITALGKSVTKTITVKKDTPKITAKAATFKRTVKTKKYVVTLKTNQNKVMKNTKVTLKVNGKTYSAKTNAKGQATFKITKLTKKGKFIATIKYAGSKYYNAKTVKPKIIVK